MKKNTHPDYHRITIKMTNGETFTTFSTYGNEGDTLQLEIDPYIHPAWTKISLNAREHLGKMAKFRKRFSSFDLSDLNNNNDIEKAEQ